MSYSEQAEKINKNLVFYFEELLKLVPNERIKEYVTIQRELINEILRFGQVAKFRCRSNTAYDNFSSAVFSGIVEVKRVKLDGYDFEVLKVV